ncbi:MAG: DEAD/DEAH box helicase, partial [Cyclobacteriaceae bacterium]|nr:DEAD/DEAH box helicase [Cyclobacteriaceae bacterium]
MNFDSFNFHPSLLEGLDAMGFTKPTPIQEQAIPEILAGNDLIACAQTGTGKTGAFVLPILHKIASGGNKGLNTLIVVPTRELAQQIDQQIEGFSYFLSVSSISIYG